MKKKKKLTRRQKIQIDKQLRKEQYYQGGHSVYIDGEGVKVVIVKGRETVISSNRKLPVPEEWWI